jgi:hypothetical protein
LPVNQVCPGFDNTGNSLVIPDTLCGSSGSAGQGGQGFALVKTLAGAYKKNPAPFNGSLIFTDADLSKVLPALQGMVNPLCNPTTVGSPPSPLGTIAWAPLAGEGIVVEGNNLLEISNLCDGSGTRHSGLSLFGIGLGLNTGDLVGFTTGKYTALLSTITGEANSVAQAGPPPITVLPALSPPSFTPPGHFTPANFSYQLQQCISSSQAAFGQTPAYRSGAAAELLVADQQIVTALAGATPFTPDSDYPNPSGLLRMRLQNIYYTINTRLQLQQALPTGAPPPPSPYTFQPIITANPPPPTTAKGGSQYFFKPTATDFTRTNDGASLTFSISGAPSWANFDPMSGTLSGTAVKGTYTGIVISVTDGCASASLPAFSIKVTG